MATFTLQSLRDRLDAILAERPEMANAPVEFTADNELSWRVQFVDLDDEGVTLRRRALVSA